MAGFGTALKVKKFDTGSNAGAPYNGGGGSKPSATPGAEWSSGGSKPAFEKPAGAGGAPGSGGFGSGFGAGVASPVKVTRTGEAAPSSTGLRAAVSSGTSTPATSGATSSDPATPTIGAATGQGALDDPMMPGLNKKKQPGGTPTPPAPLPYEEVPAAASVEGTFNRVTGQDSVLMRQAQTAGLQMANRRGLLNSSMAVGAAQAEAYKTGLSIASQQATLDAEARQKGLDRNQNLYLEDAKLKETARQNAATFLTNMEQIYAQQFNAIVSNREMKGSDRTRMIESIQNLRQNQRSFVEQIYDVDLKY